MAVIKKPKLTVFATREEFNAACDRCARLSVTIEKKMADLKKKHQDVDDKFLPEVQTSQNEMDLLIQSIEAYFQAHKKELCKPGTKSGETVLSTYGEKIGLPTVIKKIKESLKSIAARWATDDTMKKYTRNAPDVDKEEILSVFRDQERAEEQKLLNAAGFTVEQEPHEFWLKPKANVQVI